MRSFTILVPFLLVACGGDDDGGGGIKVPDASTSKMDAPPTANCTAQSDYGTPLDAFALRLCANGDRLAPCPATAMQGITGTATDPVLVTYMAQLNAQNDFLTVDLWKGFAPFESGPIGPATVDLSSGDQSQYASCGVCVYIDTQLDLQTFDSTGTYMAQAGTADITTVTLTVNEATTKLAGSLTSVDLVHVDIDNDGVSTPSADGCSTKVASTTFDLAIEDVSASFTGKQLAAIQQRILERANARLRAQAR